jgi:hypothetical protein
MTLTSRVQNIHTQFHQNIGETSLVYILVISCYFKNKDVMKVICIHGTWMLNFALVTEEYRFHLCTR